MKENDLVTIGIPVFKSVDYIRDSLSSALDQTYPNLDILIVDDCGNDGAMDIIYNLQQSHSRGQSIRVLQNAKNLGVSYCRNRIIDEAQGHYLYFLDSDDTIELQTIQLLYDSMKKCQAEVAYGSYDIIDRVNGNPTHVYQKPSVAFMNENELALYAFKYNRIFHVSVCNFLVNIDFLRKTGVRFIDVSYWEDMAFTNDFVTKVSRAVLLSDITYHYYLHPDSLSHYQQRERLNKVEILDNVSVLNMIKNKCKKLKRKPYLPYLCYNLEMISFYVACHILKNEKIIAPKFTRYEIRHILLHPISLMEILFFNDKRLSNLLFWLLGKTPIPLFPPIMWVMGKIKKSL